MEEREEEEEVEDEEKDEEDGRKGGGGGNRRRGEGWKKGRKSGRKKDINGERGRLLLKGKRRETGEEREKKVDEDGSVRRGQLKD